METPFRTVDSSGKIINKDFNLSPHCVGKAKVGDVAFLLPSGNVTTMRAISPLGNYLSKRYVGFVDAVRCEKVSVQVYGERKFLIYGRKDLWF